MNPKKEKTSKNLGEMAMTFEENERNSIVLKYHCLVNQVVGVLEVEVVVEADESYFSLLVLAQILSSYRP